MLGLTEKKRESPMRSKCQNFQKKIWNIQNVLCMLTIIAMYYLILDIGMRGIRGVSFGVSFGFGTY